MCMGRERLTLSILAVCRERVNTSFCLNSSKVKDFCHVTPVHFTDTAAAAADDDQNFEKTTMV